MSFDRFFTSVNLIHTLPFSAIGTVIKSRKNIPKFAKHLEKGVSEFLVTSSGIVASRWLDFKEVVVISNCSLPETSSISRKQKDGTKKKFQYLNAIALYNQIMGGVDLSDQKINVYDFNRKSTKWWNKVFYKIKNVCCNQCLHTPPSYNQNKNFIAKVFGELGGAACYDRA